MNKEKIKKWIYDLRRLPNIKSSITFDSCSSAAIGAVLISYLISEAIGFKLSRTLFLDLVMFAEGIATILFFTWARIALRLKVRGGMHGS